MAETARVPRTHKICPRCQHRKPLAAFPPAPSRTDGVTSLCRPCHRDNMRERRATTEGRAASRLAAKRHRDKKRHERQTAGTSTP